MGEAADGGEVREEEEEEEEEKVEEEGEEGEGGEEEEGGKEGEEEEAERPPEFFNNPASSKVNVTLAAIVEVEGLQEYLIGCMRLLTQRGMIRDLSRDDDNINDWDAAFHVIISFFNLTMDRFYSLFDAAQASNDMQEVEGMLEKWQREKPVFDGRYHSIRSVIYRLRKSLDRRQHSERQRQRMEEGQLLHAEFFPSGQHPSSMQAVDGPGELSLDGRPRHDNDHLEISAISVAPTMEEVLCKASPYLPHNHPSEPHHLPAGSVARHVDIQFRLLRHDLIAPLWSKALFLFHRLNHESSSLNARGGSSSGSSGSGGGREDAMGLLRADRELVRGLTDDMKGVVGFSSEDMDVYLLRDVHVLSINTDKRSGVYFLIDFLEPPMPRGRNARNRVEFWDNTRRLQNGSLVCLWIRDTQRSRQAAAGSTRRQQPLPPAGDTSASDSSSHRLVFATITARDTKRLATARPQIGVQPCGENGFSADLLGLIAQDGSGGRGGSKGVQVVMLEAHGSFFAYEPILKALQSITDASLPFSEYICGAAGGSPGGAPGGAPGRAPGAYKLPAYIKGGMTYDLSLLLKTKVPSSSSQQPQNTAEDEFAMRNVMISSPTAFPMDALLRCTSLDEPQSVALRAALTQEFALLQGPPGTGKTFVGIKLVEILLSNPLKSSSAGHFARGRELASSAGPILCVCFTNHALDQFLEGLIASGIKNVVRVGGRSKSEVLQEYNLLNIIRNSNLDRSRTYRQSSYEVGSKLREVEEVIGTYSNALQQRSDNVAAVAWGTLSSHLMANHPVYFQALRTSKADADGYEQVGRDNWKRWKQGLPKETLRRKKGAADMWGDQGHASGRGKGGGGGRAGGPPQGGGVGAGGVGIAASGQQAGIQNAFDALGFLGEFEVGEGWAGASSARDGGVSDELSEMVGMMATFYEGDGSGDGDEAAGTDGSWLGLVPTGRASGAGRAGGAAGAGGFPVEQDLSHAFGDLGIHNGRQGHGTNQPHCQGSSKGKKGGRQEHRSKGKEEEVVEEEVWTGPEVDERSDRGVEELLGLEDPWATSGRERRKLVESWVGELRATATAAIEAEVANYSRKVRERSELQQVEDLQVLRRAQVVGMTTSGVAKMQRLITALGPRVIIVEEAAEVLEAHILTSLTPQTQHVILIGDHLQLRPKVEVYELSKDSHKGFDLDVSLFERLALSRQIPVYTLATQRRMRPEIADLIRYTIYPDLQDHPFVQGYPDVRGMAANLHFWDHNFPETGGDDLREGKSKSNAGEAAMVVALATYLLQQGYTGGEVTILTPYVGQLLKLRQALSQVVNVRLGEGDAEVVEEAEEKAATREGGTEGDEAGNGLVAGKGKGLGLEFAAPKAVTANLKDAVRLATVDNFQGEESTVIIISLVRNNVDGKIGFLKSPNRTNVLLSRAKHGMYIIGNASTMRAATSKSVLWPRIMDMLESKGRVEKSIPLRCVNHPDTVTHIERAGEFKEKASEGGCSQMCGFRLTPCGHTCPRRCHGDDRAHANAFCPKECNRIRPLEECPHQHTCPKQCGEACGPCLVTIRALTLPCGHQAFNVPCFKAQNPASIFCSFMVEVTMPLCGHKQTVKCGEAATRVANPKLCTARCGVFLSDSCGHTCISPCGHCIVAPANTTTNQGRGLQHQLHQQQQQPQQQQQQQQQLEKTHKKCTQPCKRPHPCAHLCPDPCHSGTPCKPCTRKCLVACQHSSCPQPCHRTCAPCAEPCGWHCKHQGRCSLPCGAPCDRLPCEQRCEKKLKCGHQCPSLCSEKCPPKGFCTVEGCGEEQKREMTVDLVTLETLGEIDPDESPVLVLPCGHAYTVETLDGHLGLNQVYQEAEDGSAGGSSAAGAGAGGGVGGSAGKWVAVRPFDDGGLSALKGCPECRQPITGLRRYGRMVNKALLDESERKFALSCLADQQQLQTKLSKLSQAISACPEAAQPRQLQELARAATSLVLQANKVRVAAMEPPTQQTYQASVAALQRKHLHLGSLSSSSGADAADSPADAPEASPEKQPADSPAGLTVSAWEEECQLLYVPQPQTGPLCEALLLLGKAYQLLMTANFLQLRCLLTELHKLSRQNAARTAVLTAGLAAGHTDKNSTGREEFLARKVKNCREVVRKGLRNAERHVGEAVEWAGKRRAHRLEAKGRLEMADVFRAFVEGMMAERLLSTSPAGLDDSKEQQLEFLERAKMQCLMVASHHLVSVRENDSLGGSARRMLEKDLHELELSVRDEPRYFAVTEREKADVYEAIGLGGGHWYRCPNGHVYVIGDCGMAMQESRCPECGAAVGGGSHRLRADNTTAAGFFSRS
ncbi:unnamed protein product [Closterium sp. NIES-65]|nr:unnamed protein product [Closterium sp. NIES-65]